MSLTDMVFMGRNKAYGAYELRQNYNKNIKRALMGTLFFTTFAAGYQNLYAMMHHTVIKKDIEIVCNMAKEVKIEKPETTIKKMVPPQGKANAATTALLEKKAVKDNPTLVDTAVAIDPEVAISDHTSAGTPGEVPGVEKSTEIAIHVAEPPKETPILVYAEIMPEFPGGEAALLSFIKRNISYPAYENEIGIQGKAIVGFVIDENGKVTNVSMVRGVSKGIDKESMRVISSLPNFKPGKQSGRNVKVRYVIPIDFHQASE